MRNMGILTVLLPYLYLCSFYLVKWEANRVWGRETTKKEFDQAISLGYISKRKVEDCGSIEHMVEVV